MSKEQEKERGHQWWFRYVFVPIVIPIVAGIFVVAAAWVSHLSEPAEEPTQVPITLVVTVVAPPTPAIGTPSPTVTTLVEPDMAEPNNGAEEAFVSVVDTSYELTLGPQEVDHHDFFVLHVEAGLHYRFAALNLDGVDPAMRVYTGPIGSGHLIAENDNISPTNLGSEVQFEAQANEMVYVVVEAQGGYGHYQLILETLTVTSNDALLSPSVSGLAAVPCGPPADWTIYKVQRKDTLFSLSQATDSSVSQLMLANCLSTDLIYTGNPLYVPRQPYSTPLITPTVTPTVTNTVTNTPSSTANVILTNTPTATVTPTNTPTIAPSATPIHSTSSG